MSFSASPEPGFPAEIPRAPSLESLHRIMVRCTRCDLACCRTQVVPGAGPASARLMIVGEAPGAREDEVGIPFVGRSGMLLERMLEGAGLVRDSVFIANIVRCRPPGNRNPNRTEVAACRGWLTEQMRLVDPLLVITLGRFALQHFIPGGKITLLQATVQRVSDGGRPLTLYPLLHPSAILRNPNLGGGYAEQFRRIPAILEAESEGYQRAR